MKCIFKAILEYKVIAEEREKTELAISKKNNILYGRGRFAENPVFNYYTIFFLNHKENGTKSAGGGKWCDEQLWRLGCPYDKVQSFYDTLVDETGYDEFTPYKSWLKMKISDFIEYFLDKLLFGVSNPSYAKKLRFFNLLINYYLVMGLTGHQGRALHWRLPENAKNNIINDLSPYCEEWCNVDDPRGKTKFLGFVKK